MALATLSIDLVAKLAKFEEDMGKAARAAERSAASMENSFRRVGDAVAGLGIAAIVTDQLNRVKQAIDRLDSLDDLSEKYGIAADKLSAYSYASEVAGTTSEAFASGLGRLSKSLAAAAGGSAEQAAAFNALGVSVKNADGALRGADDVLLDLADRFAGYEDGAGKAALAQEFFGKSGADLIPVLNRGRAGIQELTEEARAFGVVIGSDAAKAAGDFNDNMKRIDLALQSISNAIASKFLPGMAQLSNTFIDAAKQGGLLYATLVSIGQGLAALTGQDELGKLQRQARQSSAEIERITNIMIGLDNTLQRDPGNQAARRRYDNLSVTLRKLQGEATDTSAKIKALVDETTKPASAPAATPKIDAPIINTKALRAGEDAAKRAKKAYDDLMERVGARIALAEQEIASGERASEADTLRIEILKRLNDADIQFTAAQRSAIEAIGKRGEAILRQNELQREAIRLTAQATREAAGQIAQADDETRSLKEQLEEFGKTAAQIESLRLARIDETIAKRESRLATMEQFGATKEAIAQERILIDTLKEGQAARRGMQAQGAQLRNDPATGAQRAVSDYLVTVNEAGEATRQAVSSSIGALENDLTQSLASGKPSVKNFVDTVIAEFYRLAVVRPLLATLFGGGEGGGAGAFGGILKLAGLFAGAAGGGGGLMAELTSYGVFAKGGAFAGGVQAFANGGIVNSPHLFKFANGGAMQAGLMGEAGPEAILPLKRGAGGRLGVSMSGGGFGKTIIINQTSGRVDKVTETRLSNGERALILQEAVRTTAAALGDPNSRMSRSMGRNYRTERNRS